MNDAERDEYLEGLNHVGGNKKITDYKARFKLNDNILEYAPAFHVIPDDYNDSLWNAINSNRFTVTLAHLYDIPDSRHLTCCWSDYIGFDPFDEEQYNWYVGPTYS